MSVLEKPKYMVKLAEVIADAKKEIILPEYRDQISDAEILGILVSKFSKWELYTIKEIVEYALEDSNFESSDLKEVL